MTYKGVMLSSAELIHRTETVLVNRFTEMVSVLGARLTTRSGAMAQTVLFLTLSEVIALGSDRTGGDAVAGGR